MRNPFSDLKPVQERMEIARHPTKEEQLDQALKLLAQGLPLEPQSGPKDRR